jgi:hypothetical protein
MGNEITNILGEEKTSNIIESVVINDAEFLDEIDKIIKKDEKLSDKLNTLRETNEELYPLNPPLDSPFLHFYVLIIVIILFIVLQTLGIINFYTNDKFILFVLIEIVLWNIYWEYFHDLME